MAGSTPGRGVQEPPGAAACPSLADSPAPSPTASATAPWPQHSQPYSYTASLLQVGENEPFISELLTALTATIQVGWWVGGWVSVYQLVGG